MISAICLVALLVTGPIAYAQAACADRVQSLERQLAFERRTLRDFGGLTGLNDIAGLHGTATEEMILDNLTSMTELARANGIRVVLASITPVCDCFHKSKERQRWQERISEVNELLRKYSAHSGTVYLDYYSAMADGENLKMSLTNDGVLPNAAGYGIMAPLAEEAITEALKK